MLEVSGLTQELAGVAAVFDGVATGLSSRGILERGVQFTIAEQQADGFHLEIIGDPTMMDGEIATVGGVNSLRTIDLIATDDSLIDHTPNEIYDLC